MEFWTVELYGSTRVQKISAPSYGPSAEKAADSEIRASWDWPAGHHS